MAGSAGDKPNGMLHGKPHQADGQHPTDDILSVFSPWSVRRYIGMIDALLVGLVSATRRVT
jgi:hypothetical protein